MTSESTVCPNCRTSFNPLNAEKFTHFGCPSCGAFFVDSYDEPKRTLRCFEKTWLATTLLPIGTRGVLDGAEYVVAGMMVKCEQEDQHECWKEYFLYTSDDTTAILAEYGGHWMLVKPISDQLTVDQYTGRYTVNYDSQIFGQFHSYGLNVKSVVGAFDWNVLDDESVYTWEYVAPPRSLVQEELHGKILWYCGSYIEPVDVAKGFAISKGQMPKRIGTGAAQPNPYRKNNKLLTTIAMCAVLLIGLTQFLLSEMHPSTTVLEEQYSVAPELASDSKLKPIVTRPFTIQHRTSVDVSVRSPLLNDWLEVTAMLVNDETGRVFEGTKSLEQYEGYEDGEHWTEDNSSQELTFSSVPAGKYHLNFVPAVEAGKSAIMDVKVRYSNWILSNFILMLLVILSGPVINWALSTHHENNRPGLIDFPFDQVT